MSGFAFPHFLFFLELFGTAKVCTSPIQKQKVEFMLSQAIS